MLDSDGIAHLAAIASPGHSNHLIMSTNVVGTANLLEAAEANGVGARVVVNKVELVGHGDAAAGDAVARVRFADYPRAGYPLHATSVAAGYGLSALREVLAGRTSALDHEARPARACCSSG